MISASVATYQNKHIKIDLIGRFTKGRRKSIIYGISNIFGALFCLVLFIAFVRYLVKIEYTSSDPAPFLGIKRWILLLILPVTFFVMSIRFFEAFGRNIYNFVKNIPEIDIEMSNEVVTKTNKDKE